MRFSRGVLFLYSEPTADWPRFLLTYKSAYTARRLRTGPKRQILTILRLRQRRCAALGRHRRLMEASNDPLVCPEKKVMTSTKMVIPIHGHHRPGEQKPSATGELRQRRCAVLGRHRRLMEASNDPLVCHISGCTPKKKEMTSTKMTMIPIHGPRRPQQKPSATGDSRAIPQPSTNPAQSCLSSMF